jgi:hypothetical protein
MAMFPKATCSIMGAATGLHTNTRRRQLCDKPHHLRAVEPFTHHNGTMCIHPHEMKHLCGNIDAEYAKLLRHWTRLLVVYDFLQPLKSLWLIEAGPHRGGSISWI